MKENAQMVDRIQNNLVIAVMPLDGMHMNGRAHGVIDKNVIQVKQIILIVRERQIWDLLMVHGVTKEME